MNTQKYILATLAALSLAACATEPKGPSQTELDAQVEAKVKAATDQLKADCDARIMQAAQLQADSLFNAQNSKAASAPKTTKTPPVKSTPAPVKQTPPPPPPTVGNGKPMMGGGSKDPGTVGNGKPKMGGTKDEQGKVDETKIGNGKPKMGGGK
ncbi:MAG TPA: hypothetical protein PLP34_00765 [Chitinophagaceae bacterium]|nr:hypothetical protein [Chitinophagaceae bacterium]